MEKILETYVKFKLHNFKIESCIYNFHFLIVTIFSFSRKLKTKLKLLNFLIYEFYVCPLHNI